MNIKTGAFAPKTNPKNASTGEPVQGCFCGVVFSQKKPTCRGAYPYGFNFRHVLTKIFRRIPRLFPLRGGGGGRYLVIKWHP